MKLSGKLILVILMCTSLAYAKDELALTKLEVFSSKAGGALVKGYTEVGSLKDQFGLHATIQANDFTSPLS